MKDVVEVREGGIGNAKWLWLCRGFSFLCCKFRKRLGMGAWL